MEFSLKGLSMMQVWIFVLIAVGLMVKYCVKMFDDFLTSNIYCNLTFNYINWIFLFIVYFFPVGPFSIFCFCFCLLDPFTELSGAQQKIQELQNLCASQDVEVFFPSFIIFLCVLELWSNNLFICWKLSQSWI